MIYYELRLVEIDKDWFVSTVKAVKDGTRFGLKESKGFVDECRNGAEPVLYDGSDFNAVLRIMKELDSVNAQYIMHNYY